MPVDNRFKVLTGSVRNTFPWVAEGVAGIWQKVDDDVDVLQRSIADLNLVAPMSVSFVGT